MMVTVDYVGDVQYEHGISQAFDNTKVIFKEFKSGIYQGSIIALLNNEAQKSKLAFVTLNILLNIIAQHNIQRQELMHHLSLWFDNVSFEEA
jgi:hypothetical protein|nr:MAG TPA: ATPase component of ABC transporter [Caudoviricetes sp.]